MIVMFNGPDGEVAANPAHVAGVRMGKRPVDIHGCPIVVLASGEKLYVYAPTVADVVRRLEAGRSE